MRVIAKLLLGLGMASSVGACLFLTSISYEWGQSVTFLLGEDRPGYNYFGLAEEHFLYDETEKTDRVVNSCRSLEDLILFLNEEHEGPMYDNIQVVLHGNPWQGLSLPIVNDGPRATKRELAKALLDNPLPALVAKKIDGETKINFWGCGIGKNPFINIALDSFFTLPDRSRPKLYTSPHFVIFKEIPQGAPKRIKASYWPYFFKRGYRPSDALISEELERQHPEVAINWEEAVADSDQLTESTLSNSLHIPVSWTVYYPSKASRPSVTTKEEQLAWVKSQPELMNQIEELGIPIEKYTWSVGKRIITKDDGTVVPAIKAIGMATVLCVLEESTGITI